MSFLSKLFAPKAGGTFTGNLLRTITGGGGSQVSQGGYIGGGGMPVTLPNGNNGTLVGWNQTTNQPIYSGSNGMTQGYINTNGLQGTGTQNDPLMLPDVSIVAKSGGSFMDGLVKPVKDYLQQITPTVELKADNSQLGYVGLGVGALLAFYMISKK